MLVSRLLWPEYGYPSAYALLTVRTISTLIIQRPTKFPQFDEPIGYNGWIEVQLEDGSTKKNRD